MGYRVRDINEIPSMEPPIPERSGFNTLASRQNTMNLNAGDRIGYRGQTQYNEKYDEDGPDIMDNPQPLAHTTYNPRELELNVNGLDHDAFTEYGDRDIMTLPRDRTLDMERVFHMEFQNNPVLICLGQLIIFDERRILMCQNI